VLGLDIELSVKFQAHRVSRNGPEILWLQELARRSR